MGRKRDAESTSGKKRRKNRNPCRSGIGAESIEKLLPYTGITSYHMSGKIVVDSAMKYRKEGIGLGLSERGDYALWQTSEEEIVKAVKVLKTID